MERAIGSGRLKTHGTCAVVLGSLRTALLEDEEDESTSGCSGWKTPADRIRLLSTKYAVLVYVLIECNLGHQHMVHSFSAGQNIRPCTESQPRDTTILLRISQC